MTSAYFQYANHPNCEFFRAAKFLLFYEIILCSEAKVTKETNWAIFVYFYSSLANFFEQLCFKERILKWKFPENW